VSRNPTLAQQVQIQRSLMQKMISHVKKGLSEFLVMKVIKSKGHQGRRKEVPKAALLEGRDQKQNQNRGQNPDQNHGQNPDQNQSLDPDPNQDHGQDRIQDPEAQGLIQVLDQDLRDHRLHPGRIQISSLRIYIAIEEVRVFKVTTYRYALYDLIIPISSKRNKGL